MLRRITALVLTFILCSTLLVLPASAAPSLSGAYDTVKFIDAMIDVSKKTVEVAGDVHDFFADLLNDDYCADSPNHFHDFVLQNTSYGGVTAPMYVCKYCYTLADTMFPDVYSDYVSSLDRVVFSSGDYYIRWTSTTDTKFASLYKSGKVATYSISFTPLTLDVVAKSSTSYNRLGSYFGPSTTYYSDTFSVSETGSYILNPGSYRATLGTYSDLLYYLEFSADNGVSWTLLISGIFSYELLETNTTQASALYDLVGVDKTVSMNSGLLYRFGIHIDDLADSSSVSGTIVGGTYYVHTLNEASLASGSLTVTVPAASSRPVSLMQTINNYNTDNSYLDNSETVNYYIGTLDTGGDVTNIYNVNLYDEETLIFTEPVTGAQYQTTGWTYDYSTRTYELSLTSGTFTLDGSDIGTIELTYGDDALTIDYYSGNSLVESDEYAYVRVAQSECALNGHTYTYETVKEADCTTPGERKYTCSVCGNQYAEDIPALGHDWNMTESVENNYAIPEGTACPDCGGTDFQVSLDKSTGTYTCTCDACVRKWKVEADITVGHSTYTCSRCGETRIESADSESGLFASIGNFIANGIGWVTDKLSDLIQSLSGINDIFSGFVESIKEKSGEFPSFLGAAIACLPEDLMTVIWFGVVAAVVLLVWKKWFH